METLFTTELNINGISEPFTVSFYNEQYHFQGINNQASFSIRREDDEWHTDDQMEINFKNAVIEKLEAYLLSQH